MSAPVPFQCASEPLHPGVSLLEASAGTGKTYALARIYLRLVAEDGLEVGKILVVTFTHAATEELRGRIRELLVDALDGLGGEEDAITDETVRRLYQSPVGRETCIRRIRLAIVCFDEAVIHTIHGFCQRVLTENSLETLALFDAELDESSDELITDAVREYWRHRMADAHPVIAAAASFTKIGPDNLVKFYRSLPSTRFYRLGFDDGMDPVAIRQQLIERFEELRSGWSAGWTEYREYVENCVKKSNRAYTKLEEYTEILEEVLGRESVSPLGLQILPDLRAAKLSVRKEFENDPKPAFAHLVEEFCQALEQFGVSVRIEGAGFLRKQIEGWKSARGLLSFEDLLRLTADAVTRETPSGERLRQCLRLTYEASLIDEFQDTDPVQFQIFQVLFGSSQDHRLFLIGDPKQSIYRFRGADLEAYFSFARETGARSYSLDTNYRATPTLVGAINAFFSSSRESPFLHSDLPFHPVYANEAGDMAREKGFAQGGEIAPALVIRELEPTGGRSPSKSVAQEAIRTDMANEIQLLLASGTIGGRAIGPADIAVLVRSNSEAREVWEYFSSRGLPAVVFSEMSLFETDEARELCWVIQGLAEAHNERSIKRALATGLLGMTTADFQRWLDDPAEWDQWVGHFRELGKAWREQGIYTALCRLFKESGAIERNLRLPDGERRVTNFLHLSEVLHQATAKNPTSPSSLVFWLRDKISQKDRSREEYQLRLESESDAIRILTVHKSKGLEYAVTFVPFLGFFSERTKGPFSYHGTDGELVVDLREIASEDRVNLGRLEENREDARVLYVALTRASSRCYLYHPYPETSEGASPGTSQGRILEEIRGQSADGTIGGWIEGRELQEMISHQFISLHPKESGFSNWRSSQPLTDPSILRPAEFPSGRSLPGGSLIQSFSSLTNQVDFNGSDLDGLSGDFPTEPTSASENDPIFEFPAGASAGNFMHDVFEHLSFDDPTGWETLVAEKLVEHQFDAARWTVPILTMVRRVMEAELHSGFSLSLLPQKDRMEEMEFLYPSSHARLEQLGAQLPADSKLKKYLAGLDASEWRTLEASGYLTGFVDLVFRHNHRYYLLDWKSNLLDGRADGFTETAVQKEMFDHHYILQYHLYLLALNRFLLTRTTGYDYDRDFGGVYYLFTRGVRSGSRNGVFFDRPSIEVIQKMDQCLSPAPRT